MNSVFQYIRSILQCFDIFCNILEGQTGFTRFLVEVSRTLFQFYFAPSVAITLVRRIMSEPVLLIGLMGARAMSVLAIGETFKTDVNILYSHEILS